MYIGKYCIIKQKILAEGSEGQLYSCYDINNKDVELCAKIFSIRKDQIQKQQDILEKLKMNGDNKNLVNIKHYDYLEQQQSLIIIMEKCQSTLKNELQMRKESKKNFSEMEIVDFLFQLLSGYQILYNHKILHRDLKPDNILINNEDGKLIYKLTDFGISKICDEKFMQMTQIGTPIYTPPEQYETSSIINDSKKDDTFPQSKRDVYSLGIILHQMMTGELPFEPKKSKEFINSIKKVPFQLKCSNFRIELIKLVESMIQYYPENRISIPQLIQQVKNAQCISQQFTSQLKFRLTNTNQQQNFIQQKQFQTTKATPQNITIQPNFNQFKPIITDQATTENQKVPSDNLKQFQPKINEQVTPQNINFQPNFNQFKPITTDQATTENQKVPSGNLNQFQPKMNDQATLQNINISLNFSQFKPITTDQPTTENQKVPSGDLNSTTYRQSTIGQNPILPNQSQIFKQSQQLCVVQIIKQYIEETINNYECLFEVEVLKKLNQINENISNISDKSAKTLKGMFKFDKMKINHYNFQRLQFFYCLINYQKIQIQKIDDINRLKQYLNDNYQD